MTTTPPLPQEETRELRATEDWRRPLNYGGDRAVQGKHLVEGSAPTFLDSPQHTRFPNLRQETEEILRGNHSAKRGSRARDHPPGPKTARRTAFLESAEGSCTHT